MDPVVGEKSLRCIRCGFCLDACPTFRLTGNEADSPRGRIYLMRSVSEGRIRLDNGVRDHIDACLGCRACETACPSGVEYAAILEHFRGALEQSGARPAGQRFARRFLLNLLTSPGLLSPALRAAAALARLWPAAARLPAPLAEILTGKSESSSSLPLPEGRVSAGRLPPVSLPESGAGRRVGVLAGCVMRVMYHDTNLATVRALQWNGCEVLAPRRAGCCGALHLHSGFMEEARSRARALLDALSGVEMDAFVVNSAGCGSTLKEYGSLLADDPVYAQRAAAFAAIVRDVSEYLDEIGMAAPTGCFDAIVAYHDACHLAHGQRITAPPRRLLAAIPGLRLVELQESDTCCGSAGIYNITEPAMARRLLNRKLDFIEASGAEVVATGNPGCLAWIRLGMAERGRDVRVMHPVEILDEAYRTAPSNLQNASTTSGSH